MMTILDYVLPGAIQVRNYGQKLLKDIADGSAALKPSIDGRIIEINHPVFVFGHLSIYPVQLAKMLELSEAQAAVPEEYVSLFKIGTPCLEDRDGKIYPKLSELSEAFFRGTDHILGNLASVDTKVLAQPLADPGRRERFGTVGAFCAYLLLAHPNVHFGQISAWRRCMGLGAV